MTAGPGAARAPVDPPAPGPVRQAPGEQAGTQLLAELRAEIARADSKASVLVGMLGMSTGVIGGLLAGRDWSPAQLAAPAAAALWLGAAALAVSLLALLMAVLPRYGPSTWRPGHPLTYFGDIQQAAHHEELARALADTERDPVTGLIDALTHNSRIVGSKHRWIRIGLATYCAGTMLLPGALLAG